MMQKINDCLGRMLEKTGNIYPVKPLAYIGYDVDSQMVELVDDQCEGVKGRMREDSPLGGTMLCSYLMQQGVSTIIQRLEDLPEKAVNGELVILSGITAWEEVCGERFLKFAESGGIVVFDATCGRKDTDAHMHIPWPGGMSKKIGIEMQGIETNSNGYDVSLFGNNLGKWVLTRSTPEFTSNEWKVWEELRYEYDNTPVVWERTYGKGKIIFVNGLMGATLVHSESSNLSVRYILNKLSMNLVSDIHPVVGCNSAFSLEQECDKGRLTAIIADDLLNRGGKKLKIVAPAGEYEEIWMGEKITVSYGEEIELTAEDGVVILWKK